MVLQLMNFYVLLHCRLSYINNLLGTEADAYAELQVKRYVCSCGSTSFP